MCHRCDRSAANGSGIQKVEIWFMFKYTSIAIYLPTTLTEESKEFSVRYSHTFQSLALVVQLC